MGALVYTGLGFAWIGFGLVGWPVEVEVTDSGGPFEAISGAGFESAVELLLAYSGR